MSAPTADLNELDEAAMALARKIDAKVEAALEPLAREMRIMKWAPEHQAILWGAVVIEARKRTRHAWITAAVIA